MKVPSKLICDRCGQEFHRSSVQIKMSDGVKRYIHGVCVRTSGGYLALKHDLCDDCVHDLLRWLKNPVYDADTLELAVDSDGNTYAAPVDITEDNYVET